MNDTHPPQVTDVKRFRAFFLRSIPVFALSVLLVMATGVILNNSSSLKERVERLEQQQKVVQTEAITRAELESMLARTEVHSLEISQLKSQLQNAVMRVAAAEKAKAEAGQKLNELADAHASLQIDLSGLLQELRLHQDQLDSLHARPAEKIPEATAIPKVPRREAPFVLTAVERRGNEAFAAIAPPGFQSLSEITLIGEGDTVQGWTLLQTEAGQATFRNNNDEHTLKIR